ncbi:MAG: NAD(P)-binding domain-containing protein, partial [Oscillospiraceae bacterium]
MKTVAFIGIGVMGNSMAQNLLNNGYTVCVYSRTKSKADNIVAHGAVWCDTIKECVKDKDVVITIVGYPKDVEQVYLGDEGIIAN